MANQARTLLQLLGVALIAWCAWAGIQHMRYVAMKPHPSQAQITTELHALVLQMGATALTEPEYTSKFGLSEARQALRAPVTGLLATRDAMHALGWRQARSGDRYCKGELVAVVTPESDGRFVASVAWGSADAVCSKG